MKERYTYQGKGAIKKGFYLIALTLMIPCLIHAQPTQNPLLYKELQLDNNSYTLQNLMHAIYAQSSISFSYNSKKINDQQKVKIQERKITVYNAMAAVKKKTGIRYRMIGNHIILMAGNNTQSKISKKQPVAQEAIVVLSQANDPENIQELKEADVFIPTKGVVDMNIKADTRFLSQPDNAPSGVFSAQDGMWIDPYASLNSAPGEDRVFKASGSSFSLKNHLQLQIGISADELYYLNPTLHAGFDFLYATVSYNAIGKYPHVRIGIGSSIKLTDNWRLHINANTGPARSAPFSVRRVTDSFFVDETDTSEGYWSYIYDPVNMQVKSRLNRVSLNLEWKPAPTVSIIAGATLNLLQTTYESGGNPIRLGDFSVPPGDDPENDYVSIKPPYILSSNFSTQRPDNTKLWIGFYVSVLYNIPLFNSR